MSGHSGDSHASSNGRGWMTYLIVGVPLVLAALIFFVGVSLRHPGGSHRDNSGSSSSNSSIGDKALDGVFGQRVPEKKAPVTATDYDLPGHKITVAGSGEYTAAESVPFGYTICRQENLDKEHIGVQGHLANGGADDWLSFAEFNGRAGDAERYNSLDGKEHTVHTAFVLGNKICPTFK